MILSEYLEEDHTFYVVDMLHLDKSNKRILQYYNYLVTLSTFMFSTDVYIRKDTSISPQVLFSQIYLLWKVEIDTQIQKGLCVCHEIK